MARKINSEENAQLYSDVISELEKTFGHLGELIISNRATIQNIANIKKLMGRDKIRFHEDMVNLNLGIDLFNDGLRNVVNFIRQMQLGELEDIALYLETCYLPDFSDALSRNSWFESKDIKSFARNLSEERIRQMLTEITNIAYGDHNVEFLRSFKRSKLVA